MYKNFFNEFTNKKVLFSWKKIPWKQQNLFIRKLQEQIYKEALRGEFESMNKFQKIILYSLSSKFLAIKIVTDKSPYLLTDATKIKLALSLDFTNSHDLYSYWQKLQLNIKYSIFQDIYTQCIAIIINLILEPQWEAYLEPNILGGRAGHYPKDLIQQILSVLKKYKLNYAILGSLDFNFNKKHKNIIWNKLHNTQSIKNLISFYFSLISNLEYTLPQSYPVFFCENHLTDLFFNILTYGFQYNLMQNSLFFNTNNKNSGISFNSLIYINYGTNTLVLCNNKTQTELLNQVIQQTFAALQLNPYLHTTFINPQSSKFEILGFLFKFHKYSINVIPNLQKQKELIYNIRKILYKKDFIGRTRAMNHITLGHAIDKINPLLVNWINYYNICTNVKYFHGVDQIINESIYRWQIKKYKKKIVNSWNTQCIRYIKNKKRIAQGNKILKLLSQEYSKFHNIAATPYYRSVYDQNNIYWRRKKIYKYIKNRIFY